MRSGLLGLGSATALVGWVLVFATDHWVTGAAAIYAGSGLILIVVTAGLARFAVRALLGAWRSWASGESAENPPAQAENRLEPPALTPWQRASSWVGSRAMSAIRGPDASATRLRRLGEPPRTPDEIPSTQAPAEPQRVWLDTVSLSADASIVAILALAAIALIVLPPLDSDYHPGTAAEWVLYAVVVVPAGAALAARSIKRIASDYRDAWALQTRELFPSDSRRERSEPRN